MPQQIYWVRTLGLAALNAETLVEQLNDADGLRVFDPHGSGATSIAGTARNDA